MLLRAAAGVVASLPIALVAAGFLRGSSKSAPSRRHMVVVIVLVLLAGAVVANWSSAIGIGMAIVLLGVPIATVDGTEHRVPDLLSLPLCGVVVLVSMFEALASNHLENGLGALGGSALWGGSLLLSYVITGQPGPGDVKLAPSAGALLGWFGWGWALTGLVAAYLLTAVAGTVGALVAGCSIRRYQVPMAPPMIVVALVGATLAQL